MPPTTQQPAIATAQPPAVSDSRPAPSAASAVNHRVPSIQVQSGDSLPNGAIVAQLADARLPLPNVRHIPEYQGVKEKLRKHVEGLTKELYEQLVKKMFSSLECTPDGKQLRQNKRLDMKTLRDVQSNLRGEMDQLVDDLFVPFMSQITKGPAAEPADLRDAKDKLRKCMDDIVRDLFGPFLNELNDLFRNAEGINLVDAVPPERRRTARQKQPHPSEEEAAEGEGEESEAPETNSKDKMELVQTIARLQRKAQEKAALKPAKCERSPNGAILEANGDVDLDSEEIEPVRIQCIHDGCKSVCSDWTALEIHLKDSHGFIGSVSIDSEIEDSSDDDDDDGVILDGLTLHYHSFSEQHSQLLQVMAAANRKSLLVEDLIEAEEELDLLELAQLDDAEKPVPFRCSEGNCNTVVASLYQLNKHLIYQHDILPHTCNVCNGTLDDNLYGTEVFSHIWERHRDFTGDYMCKDCSKPFSRHRDLVEHAHLYHTSTTISACDLTVVGESDPE